MPYPTCPDKIYRDAIRNTRHALPRPNQYDHEGMPKFVPVFTAEDLCKNRLHDGQRHCAQGWREALGIPPDRFNAAYRAANNLPPDREITTHNDVCCKTDAARAAALNMTMLQLGYTEYEEY